MNRSIKGSLLLSFLILFVSGFAQILEPVKWTFSSKKISDCEYELLFKAKIDDKFHLYSQDAGEGPVSTTFTFEKNPSVKLVGKTSEPKPLKVMDPNFGAELKFFEHEAVFKQKVKFLKDGKTVVKGGVEFMSCDDKMCLPPEIKEFELSIDGKACEESAVKATDTAVAQGDGIAPVDSSLIIKDTVVAVNPGHVVDKSTIAPVKKETSYWKIFLGGFLGGLLALFTPCVFPMLPLTVSFFTKQSKTRRKGVINASIYSLSIILIYVTLGLLITIPLGPDALNALASNGIMNMAFFLIFVVFAISFLGAFEITLPSSWINRADSASERGGMIGIFFMAFTLSLVSFSCTGPIIGTLLVEAAVGGNVMGPAIGMIGFSSALALPFGLFAAFPGWLNSLPKSGSWLNTVKVVLGLLELALALKFLSNVDLAYHWGFLKREIFIALWIVIFSMLGFYLLGKLKFSHDSDQPYITIPRFMFSLLAFAFVIYLIPGLWGAPLKMISGFPPPTFYNEGWSGSSGGSSQSQVAIPGTDPSHCPHGLNCFHDYDAALAYAKTVGKPLMVDFTGYSCVNCRKMEDNVWSDPRVLQRLRDEYVLVSLYVDDKENLPKEKQYLSATTGKKVKTLGNKWSDFETTRFGTNSQPYYVLLDHNEELLTEPSGYDPDIESYVRFLDKGKNAFAERKKPM